MSAAGYIQAQFTIPEDLVVHASNGSSMGLIDVTIPAGTYYLTGPGVVTANFCETFEDLLNAAVPAGWTVTWSGITGKVTINCTDPDWALELGADLAALLGFAGDIASRSAPATGTLEALGMWLPYCSGVLDVTHRAAPIVTDHMQTESPNGFVIGHVANSKRVHLRLRYTHVQNDHVWTQSTTEEHLSLEQFLRTAQWGMGHAWFTPSSKCCILFHDNTFVGNLQVDGWYLRGLGSAAELAKRVQEAWDGYYTVEFPGLVSNG